MSFTKVNKPSGSWSKLPEFSGELLLAQDSNHLLFQDNNNILISDKMVNNYSIISKISSSYSIIGKN